LFKAFWIGNVNFVVFIVEGSVKLFIL